MYEAEICILTVSCLITAGPLFSFDVHEDIRLVNDASVEKDEVRTHVCVVLYIKCVLLCACSRMLARWC